jgi:hypothetical protein
MLHKGFHHDQVFWTKSFLDVEFILVEASTMNIFPILSVLFIGLIAITLPHRPRRVRRGLHVRF